MTTPATTTSSPAHLALTPATVDVPITATGRNVERDLRVARALRTRRAVIREEMQSCLRQRAAAYALADAFLDEFDELAAKDKEFRRALMQIEQRLQRVGAYFLSEEQTSRILSEIAEVGADTRRFCAYLGVPAIAQIPAHEFDSALAALDRKRRRAA
jgi:hypothetical protein